MEFVIVLAVVAVLGGGLYYYNQKQGTGWRPTHRAPEPDLAVWSEPDAAAQPRERIAAGTELKVLVRRGAWARVNRPGGWSGWVDGRILEEVGPDVPPPVAAPQDTGVAEVIPAASGPSITLEDDAAPAAVAAVMAVPAAFVSQFQEKIESFSASLTGVVLRPGDRLVFAGIPLAVASVTPAEGTVTVDTEVRVRRTTGAVTATCGACGSETTLPAGGCGSCSGALAVTPVAEKPAPATAPAGRARPQRAAVPAASPSDADAMTLPEGRRRLVPLVAGLLIVAGAFIPWLFYGGDSLNSVDARLWGVLFNSDSGDGPNVLIPLLVVAWFAWMAAVARVGWVRKREQGIDTSAGTPGQWKAAGLIIVVCGFVAALLGGIYLIRLWGDSGGMDTFIDVLGWGPILTLIGGLALVRSEGRQGGLRKLMRVGRVARLG